MDIKIAQQETITELVLENQKLKQERDEWAAMCGIYKQERDEARAERDILRLNSLGTIQLNIPVTTDWKEETK
jgi:hypothetical protein